jgi:osmotically-inducible protein OsmY
MSLAGKKRYVSDSRRQAGISLPREKEIIEARAACRLQRSPYLEVRRVACEFHEGMLCLHGRVTSYYMKQIAQTVVFGMDGVEEINNQLEVVTPPGDW